VPSRAQLRVDVPGVDRPDVSRRNSSDRGEFIAGHNRARTAHNGPAAGVPLLDQCVDADSRLRSSAPRLSVVQAFVRQGLVTALRLSAIWGARPAGLGVASIFQSFRLHASASVMEPESPTGVQASGRAAGTPRNGLECVQRFGDPQLHERLSSSFDAAPAEYASPNSLQGRTTLACRRAHYSEGRPNSYDDARREVLSVAFQLPLELWCARVGTSHLARR
jgi:hypothetical protein